MFSYWVIIQNYFPLSYFNWFCLMAQISFLSSDLSMPTFGERLKLLSVKTNSLFFTFSFYDFFHINKCTRQAGIILLLTTKKIKPTLTVTENKLKEEKLCRWEKLASSNVAKKNWGENGKSIGGRKGRRILLDVVRGSKGFFRLA